MDIKLLKTEVELSNVYLDSIRAKYGNHLPLDMSILYQEYEKMHQQLEHLGALMPNSLKWMQRRAVAPTPSITTSAIPYARKTIAIKGIKTKQTRHRERITPRTSRDFRHMVLEVKRTRRLVSHMQDTLSNFSLNMAEHFNQYVHDSENDSLHSDNFDTDSAYEEDEEDSSQ